MANIVCWICRDELSYAQYDGTKLLDDDGSKPCLQCIQEEAQNVEAEDNNEF
jgi:hypothetical protein